MAEQEQGMYCRDCIWFQKVDPRGEDLKRMGIIRTFVQAGINMKNRAVYPEPLVSLATTLEQRIANGTFHVGRQTCGQSSSIVPDVTLCRNNRMYCLIDTRI